MTHTHSHGSEAISGRRMTLAIALTLAFVIGEAIAGYFSQSLALLSDAGHNFADALALMLSAYALWMAKTPSNPQKTFGYHRIGILAAVTNALSLVLIAVLIATEAYDRFQNPVPVQAVPMILVALAAIGVNAVIAVGLHAGSKNDLNVRSAYRHMVGDAAAAVGVLVAGVIVALTGASIVDPIVSLLIAALILGSSWGILSESINVLLECSPKGMDMTAVEQVIQNVPGVLSTHDLHVWTVGPGAIACSCHIIVAEQSIRSGQQVLKAVVSELAQQFKINHTTVQVEVDGCGPNEMYCTLGRTDEHGH